ncbi:hypothetical protein ACIQTZ_22890 [Paenarthrobacter sp. NPDC090520]|uniref:hypothetical protein n=1 Tax=Paenarthrobacter sp. NPDC090520 TaxID=3364382 RepID=UPI00380BCDC4
MAEKDEWADFDELSSQEAAAEDTPGRTKPKRRDRRDERKTARKERRDQWQESVYKERISPGARILGVVAILAIIFGIGWFAVTMNGGKEAETVGIMKPGATGEPGQPSASPSLGMGDSSQAAVPAQPAKTFQPVKIPAPAPVTANPQNAEEVAKAWAKGYLSRPAGESTQWQEYIGPYTATELVPILDGLAFHGKDPLAGKEPTSVLEVKVLPAPKGEPVDTPTRWTRSVEVPVQSHDGSTTVLTYTVTSYLGEKGWQVTDAVQKFWTVR